MSRVGGSSGGSSSSSGSTKKQTIKYAVVMTKMDNTQYTLPRRFNTWEEAVAYKDELEAKQKSLPKRLYRFGQVKQEVYAKGVKRTKRDELAITQDPNGTSNTREMIVSPSTGQVLIPLTQQGMLTSLRKGDSVLPNKFTENIWSMGEDPSKFIAEQLKNNPLANKLNLGLELPKVTPLNNLAGLGNISMDNRVIVQGDISEANVKRMQNIAQQTINTNFEKLNRNLRKVGLR